MTIILDKCVCAPHFNTNKTKLEFLCICVRGNDSTLVSTILPLYISAVLRMLYI